MAILCKIETQLRNKSRMGFPDLLVTQLVFVTTNQVAGQRSDQTGWSPADEDHASLIPCEPQVGDVMRLPSQLRNEEGGITDVDAKYWRVLKRRYGHGGKEIDSYYMAGLLTLLIEQVDGPWGEKSAAAAAGVQPSSMPAATPVDLIAEGNQFRAVRDIAKDEIVTITL